MQTPDTPWRDQSTIEENPIGLPRDAAAQIIATLDKHLATFFVLFHQYQKHHWLVEGPQFRDLHDYFEESYSEVHKDLDAIAERITALGGIPTCKPSGQERLSAVAHEEEGTFRIRHMLERDRAAEGILASALRKTAHQCVSLSDFGTETLIKSVLLRVEERAHHLDHFLGDDSLGAIPSVAASL